METIYSNRISEIKREKQFLENTLKCKIQIKGKRAIITGDSIGEYEAERVFDAINMGFSARTAALLIDENFAFEKIKIRDFTRRKNLELVKGRLIGTHGKTKNTLEQISDCEIKIKDNEIGIIGPAESISNALTGIKNIIKGTKQSNVYKYLERINTKRKNLKL